MSERNVAGMQYAMATMATSIRRGTRLLEEGRPQDALTAFNDAADRFGRFTDDDGVPSCVVVARYERSVALRALGLVDESIRAVQELMSEFARDRSSSVRHGAALALAATIRLLQGAERTDEQLSMCDEMEELFGADPSPVVREQVACALHYKGVLIYLGEPAHAMAALEHVLSLRWPEPTSRTREALAIASMRRVTLLAELRRGRETLDACDQLIRNFDGDTDEAVRACVENARDFRDHTLERIADPRRSFWETQAWAPAVAEDSSNG
jgi:tetratricopeptide (TPR) repeat protein